MRRRQEERPGSRKLRGKSDTLDKHIREHNPVAIIERETEISIHLAFLTGLSATANMKPTTPIAALIRKAE